MPHVSQSPVTVADATVGIRIALLARESLHSVVHPFAGVCDKSGAPLATVRLAWDDEVLGEHDLARKRRGGWTHQVRRHSDGTHCMGAYGDPDDMQRDCHSQPRCPQCGSYNTLVTSQEAWLDRTTCTAKGPGSGYKPCTYEHVYMIGD